MPELNNEAESAHHFYSLGNAAFRASQKDEALAWLDRAISLDPQYVEAYVNRGVVLRSLGRLDAALESYDGAIAVNPAFVPAHHNRGNLLVQMGDLSGAVTSFQAAIALDPKHPHAFNNCASALRGLGKLQEALSYSDRAIDLDPDSPDHFNNRGAILFDLQRLDEALVCFEKTVSLDAGSANAHFNLGSVLRTLGRVEEALASRQIAVELAPQSAEARWNLALVQLQLGLFEEGWENYEWRKLKAVPLGARFFVQPLWDGQVDIAGTSLFVHAEQGFGDTLQFSRYALMAAGRGALVTMQVPARLKRLMSSIGENINVIGDDENLPAFDLHCPMMSLPRALKTRADTIPSAVRYLKADLSLVEKWRGHIGSHGFRVGIVWQGNASSPSELGRSIPLEMLRPLSLIPGVRLISLQKGSGTDQLVTLPDGMIVEALGDDFDEGSDAFMDTAAVLENLDLMISVDTSVAHLAGVLARPTWVFLKKGADWRWFSDREDTPWYPTMRLFRQSVLGEWQAVVEQMAEELRVLVATKTKIHDGQSPSVPVSWGELFDKISILEIKQRRIVSNSAQANIQRELSALSGLVTDELATHPDILKILPELTVVNEAIWDVEDIVRQKEAVQQFDAEFIEAARTVYRENDKRAAIKRKINLLMRSELVEEKQHI